MICLLIEIIGMRYKKTFTASSLYGNQNAQGHTLEGGIGVLWSAIVFIRFPPALCWGELFLGRVLLSSTCTTILAVEPQYNIGPYTTCNGQCGVEQPTTVDRGHARCEADIMLTTSGWVDKVQRRARKSLLRKIEIDVEGNGRSIVMFPNGLVESGLVLNGKRKGVRVVS